MVIREMIKHVAPRRFHSLATTATAAEFPQPPSCKPFTDHNCPRLLRSCENLQSLLQIHARILVSGLPLDDLIPTLLVNSYSSFHKPDSARFVLDSATNPSVFSWNSVIRAYTRANQHRHALEMYHIMLDRRVEPDKFSFTFVLKACTGVLDLKEGASVHEEIVRKGLESDVYIGTGLIDMYSKMGMIEKARELFERMPKLDVVAWNAMIAGSAQSLNPYESLDIFRKMQSSGVLPNSVSLLNLIPAISRLLALSLCKSVHGFVVRRVFPFAILNGLIDMYSKCGDVEIAHRIFDGMWDRDEVSWGTMISGYAQNGYFGEALELFDDLRRENLKLNQVSAVGALSAAAEMKDLEKGMDIHYYMIREGVTLDISVTTTLMTMYAKCGCLEKAKQLFFSIRERDMVAWSALIAACAQTGHPEEAMSCFRDMQLVDIRPNKVTIVSVLPACAELLALNMGKSIHCYAIKANMSLDSSAGTALVSMYVKCGSFTMAHVLFNRFCRKDVVTWNALINGYAQLGDGKNAMKMFHHLLLAGIQPDSGTMVGVLPACVLLEALDQGRSVHGQIVKGGFESDLHVKNALIDMYAKCGSLRSAEILFDEADFPKDEISWNIMIAGSMQNGQAKEAITYFHRMKTENLKPNLVTFVSILPAASYLAALREGMALHSYIIRKGFESYTVVGNSIIDMYSKCGRLDLSQEFFDRMSHTDIVSWNVMLSGFAIHGLGEDAVKCFSQMKESSVKADSVSFVSVLSACRHGGLVEEGRQIFEAMSYEHHLQPNLEHYACMVDLLGRTGRLDEAWNLITKMPMIPDAGVWGALLGACRTHSNVKLGEVAFDHLIRLEPQNPAHYVVLSNVYAQIGRWAAVGKMRKMMNSMGLTKLPGCSWVEIKGVVHAFRVGDKSHPQLESICIIWNDLHEKMEKMGYVPDTSHVLQNVEEEEKQSFLHGHSERLAIAFAILNTEEGCTIQIVKNLRVCGDCHNVTKLVSQITHRRIIVRDASRFHHFENGTCSCKDYW